MLQPNRSSQQRGFTIIELLVTISIIGILVSLLLPAVQQAREAARRAACSNNLRQLALATHLYHDSLDTFPPGAVGPYVALPQFAGLRSQHGLGTHLLPYLDQQALYNNYSWDVSWFDPPNQPVVKTQLSVWQCPSAPANRIRDGALPTVAPPPPSSELFTGTAACGDYAGMAYVDKDLVSRGVIDPLSGPRESAGHYEGVFPANDCRRFRDILDGTSHTLLMAECAGRPQLWQVGREVPNLLLSGGPWASRNLFFCRGAMQDGTDFYGPCAVNCTNNREVYSFHTGGANAAFADASVRFLSASIDIRVFAALVTRAGGEVVPTDF